LLQSIVAEKKFDLHLHTKNSDIINVCVLLLNAIIRIITHVSKEQKNILKYQNNLN